MHCLKPIRTIPRCNLRKLASCGRPAWGCITEPWPLRTAKALYGSGVASGTVLSKAQVLSWFKGSGADAPQLTLVPRFSFRARLKPGVAMTSEVKSWVKIRLRLSAFCCPLGDVVHRPRRSQEETTGAQAALRGLAPTFLASGGGRPRSRHEGGLAASERQRGGHHTGAAPLPMAAQNRV
jgi:hypothetical protein